MARLQSFAALAAAAAAAVLAGLLYRRRCDRLSARVRELEDSLADAVEKAAAERRGRVRAQQSLRRALSEQGTSPDKGKPAKAPASYPTAPIGTVQSCFSTRNGTPRQPLVVPLARATVVLNPARVAAEALEGLASYSHCWILYVFHLNTDLDKMWKDPARSKLKVKVRVPRLKGGKMGVLVNGTPRQPLVVPLARATVLLHPACVQTEALEGLTNYSHCWILYVLHLNTDLIKCGKALLGPRARVPGLMA
ncbi:hypothetical protein CFC21_071726 [Triticum aestivum]|uniref:TsaA-like domain-containing protein n=2 Tax=Triticum aestivum TaxID=4565 RepID=A0A3B6LMQ9_WHEAT|nr:uncharacterized protein LOC123112051 [Triticum aestivum]XP_044388890.1 uncharacterized protein LOC123112051 [Triticum aestivum]XP_044388891.1 uncharacterized protein LOC123112051 [Triticum aestivum]XP_044388892.1 uncharacterized protein LOC123112051 [Triticum aestivum]XP_044388893.1 uncharacterized protein LOC123112051 [Triticum aestivum]XP_044388894.1 uncharacterized protein LOC123112051 [Triticum aestivum]XP_044388895.1 uncharacterized protein LOC123112051 [Triticum aestivum]XP_04438889